MKTMKFKLLLIALFFTYCGFATHNRGGFITYEHVSGTTYKIVITTITEIGNNNADRPELGVDFADGTIDTLPRAYKKSYLGSNFFQENVYEGKHTFPGPGWYEISVTDPNRNGGIINIPNSIDVPFYIQTTLHIPIDLSVNNSPIPVSPIILNAKVNETFKAHLNVTDWEGDFLLYEIVNTKRSRGVDIPGFTPLQATLDGLTGELTWTPTNAGEYVLTVLVTECKDNYRTPSIAIDYMLVAHPSGAYGEFDGLGSLPTDSLGNRTITVYPGDVIDLSFKI